MGKHPEPDPDGSPLRQQVHACIEGALIVLVGVLLALAVLRWLVLA